MCVSHNHPDLFLFDTLFNFNGFFPGYYWSLAAAAMREALGLVLGQADCRCATFAGSLLPGACPAYAAFSHHSHTLPAAVNL